MKNLAIVLAAGKGSRMESVIPKQYINVCDKPLFLYSLQTFLQASVDEIALVVAKGEEAFVKTWLAKLGDTSKKIRIIIGGLERYQSVYHALDVYRAEEIGIVSIHDSARAAISLPVVEASIADAKQYKASVVAVTSKDTVKLVDEGGFVIETPKREGVYLVQTPQSFDFKTLLKAYDLLMAKEDLQVGITDDAMVVERVLDIRVKITKGEYSNIKVTTKEDIAFMESIIKKKEATDGQTV